MGVDSTAAGGMQDPSSLDQNWYLFSLQWMCRVSTAGTPVKSQTRNYLLKRLVFLQLNGLGTQVENQLLIDVQFMSELSVLSHLFIYVSLCHCFYYFHL